MAARHGVEMDIVQPVHADPVTAIDDLASPAEFALLVIGMFIEENTAIVILTPLLLPVVTSYGVDPLQFGMIMVLNLGMGLATPPFAPNLFVAQSATGAKFHTMIVPALRLLTLGVLPVLIVVNAFPVLTTFMR